MNSSPICRAEALACDLIEGLRAELHLTPKPGLVDLHDSGSHPDLNLPLMEASICLVESYLRDLLVAVVGGAGLRTLMDIGRRAEERMMAELGTNTHRGAIFLCGLLVAARSRTHSENPGELSRAVAALACEFFAARAYFPSHGAQARERYGLGGVVKEAMEGLPSLFRVALPAYRQSFALQADPARAAFFMMARLMQTVEDTTALHRCAAPGLARLRRDGLALEKILAAGLDPIPLLAILNDEYRAMNLTMGGVADLIGLASGYLLHLRRVDPPFDFSDRPEYLKDEEMAIG